MLLGRRRVDLAAGRGDPVADPARAEHRGPARRGPRASRRGSRRALPHAVGRAGGRRRGAGPSGLRCRTRSGPFGEAALVSDDPTADPQLILRRGTIRGMIDQQPITLRPATTADAERIAALFTDEGYPAATSTIVDRIERFCAANGQVIVAEDAGEILGFVAVHVMPRFEHDDTIARILALVVDAGARGRGVGSRPHGGGGAGRPRGGRRVHRGDRRPPPAGGPPPVRGASATTRRSRPTCGSDSDRRAGGRGPVPASPPPHGGPGPARACPGSARSATGRADAIEFRELPVGPSRHLVRFVLDGDAALRPQGGAARDRPARVRDPPPARGRGAAGGRPGRPGRGARAAPRRSSSPRTSPTRSSTGACSCGSRSGSEPYRDRLLDAMASLLVDLHRGGVYWGDCSLANTLFRRDGDKIQAFLVDAETSEVHPSLSDGQRAYDLEVLVENVAFGLADLAAYQGRADEPDDGRSPRPRASGPGTAPCGTSSMPRSSSVPTTGSPSGPGPPAQRPRLLGRRDRARAGRSRRQAAPAGRGDDPPVPHPRARAADRDPGARGPGPDPHERPARVPGLARVVREAAGRPGGRRRPLAARRLRADAWPGCARRSTATATSSRPTATSWSTSGCSQRRAGRDVGLEKAVASYLAIGAPAPEAEPA